MNQETMGLKEQIMKLSIDEAKITVRKAYLNGEISRDETRKLSCVLLRHQPLDEKIKEILDETRVKEPIRSEWGLLAERLGHYCLTNLDEDNVTKMAGACLYITGRHLGQRIVYDSVNVKLSNGFNYYQKELCLKNEDGLINLGLMMNSSIMFARRIIKHYLKEDYHAFWDNIYYVNKSNEEVLREKGINYANKKKGLRIKRETLSKEQKQWLKTLKGYRKTSLWGFHKFFQSRQYHDLIKELEEREIIAC